MSKKGLLLVGHGSSLPFNKQLVEDTARLVSRKDPGYIVKCAFMNLNTPTIQEALEEFRKEDIESVVVVPLFLARGVHINKDIPGVLGIPEGSYRGTLQKNGSTIPLVYADPIGSDPLLAELMLKNAERALREHL
ncbi:MAG TPA: sirohydrochlorin nickelochelatase [Methanomicrobiales archaeon]|jgi:sirohydrochlorin cobaltochelatase|nr:sirohydrochlorin nickelochelatase [Methanomicrobiales archaeon]